MVCYHNIVCLYVMQFASQSGKMENLKSLRLFCNYQYYRENLCPAGSSRIRQCTISPVLCYSDSCIVKYHSYTLLSHLCDKLIIKGVLHQRCSTLNPGQI